MAEAHQSQSPVSTPAAVAESEQQLTETEKNSKKTNEKERSREVLANYEKIDVGLRAVAVAATLAAAVVMATNKQTRLLPVGPLVNNRPLLVPVTAKYHYSPAYVFFVVTNAVAGGYALLSMSTFGATSLLSKKPRSDLHKSVTAFFDLVAVGGLAAGASAATAISDLARKGNTHSKWMKICDRFSTFCDHGGGALLASFSGVAIFMLLNVLATVSIYRSARAFRAQAEAAAASAASSAAASV